MHVVAAIFAAQPATALAEIDGVPAVRHLALLARDAGVSRVLVVSFDPDGAVEAAIEGVATIVDPAPPDRGPVAQLIRGVDAAVATDPATSAVLLWPARSTNVTADTVRALLAAHDEDAEAVIRPGPDDATGFPALFPVRHRGAFDAIGPDRMPGEVLGHFADSGVPTRILAAGEAGRA
jgi:CTP:molybdopterin cytidylyltransferase MocA